MAKFYDYERVAQEAGLSEEQTYSLVAARRRIDTSDEVTFELNLLKLCLAIRDGALTIDEAIDAKNPIELASLRTQQNFQSFNAHRLRMIVRKSLQRLGFTKGIAIFSLVISLISLAKDWSQSKQIDRIDFHSRGQMNRPLIEISQPEKIHYTLEVLAPGQLQSGRHLKCRLTVDPELSVTNQGTSVARIMAFAVTDKYSGHARLRSMLLKGRLSQNLRIEASDGFYRVKHMTSGDMRSMRMPHTITDFEATNNEFVIHYLVLYENEVGNVFDSYRWVRFRADPIPANFTVQDHLSTIEISKEALDGKFRVIDTDFSTYMYTKSESHIIYSLYNEAVRKLKED